jgi:Transposase DDE domain group 1
MKDDTEPKSETPAPTECDGQPLLFPDFGPRPVVVDFNGGDVSSDGGSVLLGQTDRSRVQLRRFALCFTDHRDPDSIEHNLEELLRQRIYGLALAYEDLNGHDRLAHDPFWRRCVEK